MRHARVLGLASLAILVVGAVAFAQTTVAPLPDNPPVETAPLEIDMTATTWGDAQVGEGKAAVCAACHGVDGNPIDPMYPRIAGQSERYSAHQLALFASGQRTTGLAALMVPYAQALSPQDMRDVGAFYATQKAGAGLADDTLIVEGGNAGLAFYQVGERLYRSGDAARDIPSCMGCHGPSGAGNPGPAYPLVAGQMEDYTARRLQEYREGVHTRQDPALFNVMHDVARNLTDEEIQSLSTYLQGLHDRANDAVASAARGAAAPAAAPAAPPAPAAAAPVAEPAPPQS